MTGDLFADQAPPASPADPPRREAIGPGAMVLRGLALAEALALRAAVDRIAGQAPWRHMLTPGGRSMSVAVTNCGRLGWTSDRHGYRYSAIDPETGLPWPAMPELLSGLATRAAAMAGFPGFAPDACLINRYVPGSRLSLHQDRDEQDLTAPIVSVSLGLPAVFQFGGHVRGDRPARVPLQHGDVVVWGGPDRLRFHGVIALKPGVHSDIGERRINLTLRKAGA